MLNSPMLSIFQHFHAIPLRSPLISLRSKWRLTGFSRRFTPKNPVRLHKPFGQLPRWGAKNVLPLNLIALLIRDRLQHATSKSRRLQASVSLKCTKPVPAIYMKLYTGAENTLIKLTLYPENTLIKLYNYIEKCPIKLYNEMKSPDFIA